MWSKKYSEVTLCRKIKTTITEPAVRSVGTLLLSGGIFGYNKHEPRF